ncbi:MAG: DNA methyltransferase [Aestuariivita sp.]|nr:DNA methyltransferase [Aestuariivita sp.]
MTTKTIFRYTPKSWTGKIHIGDCLDVMEALPTNSVDLIVTSPPYADARKHTYGGIAPDDYVDWFAVRGKEMLRILKPTGSFVLNIKEN